MNSLSMVPAKSYNTLTISTGTVIRVALAALALYGLYLIADIVLLVITALFLAAALEPWVDSLYSRHIPRAVSMIGIYVILFSVLSIAIILIIPPVIEQITTLAQNFPGYYQHFNDWYATLGPWSKNVNTQGTLAIPNAVSFASQGFLNTLSTVFGGLISFLTILVMTFYLVVDEGAIKRTVAIAPIQHQTYLANLYERLQTKIGIWLRAQLILMAIVGLMTYVLLSALRLVGIDMPYALTLALIAGLTEFVPYVGPIMGAIPAVLIAYAVSPMLALIVASIYYIIQLTENNILVPKIMERALGLSPIISIVVFLIGAKLAGITGAFLAIPIATAAAVILKDVFASSAASGSPAP